ncbi:MAG TPA: BatA and WFA domain-containing protein [Planctomycetaceae bacterium]
MNWIGFSWLSGLWLLAVAAPIVLFYFLKLRRPRAEVPSLALWRQVMNDQRVNSPFQKFKRNLLLLFQLLLLLAVTLAAAQPFVRGDAANADYVPVLIDHSASMAALDRPGGRSRLDEAKAEVRQLIDDLLPGQRLSIIAVGSTAQRVTDFTDNKRLLHTAVDGIEPLPVESRLEDGLRVTQALARTVPVETVLFFSDGNVPPEIPFELPFQLNYRRLPAGGANLGITAFNARRAGPESWEVFARVEASQAEPAAGVSTATLEIKLGNEVLASERVSLPAKGNDRYAVRIDTDRAATVTATLVPDGFDSLASDNAASLDLPVPRPLTVYCPEELDSYRHALTAIENLVVYPNGGDAGPSSYDLVVSDKASDLDAEAPVAMYVGVIPPDLAELVTVKTSLAELVDWRRSEPLLQHVQLAEVQTSDEPQTAEGVRNEDFEERGYEVLAFGRSGPLLLKKSTPKRIEYFFLFHTDRSTLPYRIGFPILVSNLVQETLRGADLLEVRAGRTGVLDPIPVEPNAEYAVTNPAGETVSVRAGEAGQLSGVPAPAVGRYVVKRGGRTVATVGASLTSPPETGMAVVETLQFKEVEVAADEGQLPSDKPLWRYFAFAGFGLLLAEWWLFQRRPRRAGT